MLLLTRAPRHGTALAIGKVPCMGKNGVRYRRLVPIGPGRASIIIVIVIAIVIIINNQDERQATVGGSAEHYCTWSMAHCTCSMAHVSTLCTATKCEPKWGGTRHRPKPDGRFLDK
jgi:hypothetical protein